MGYWVYENRTAKNNATIHLGSCPHCNDGKGQEKEKFGTANDKWHGSFDSYDMARLCAKSLETKTITDCGRCKPESSRRPDTTG